MSQNRKTIALGWAMLLTGVLSVGGLFAAPALFDGAARLDEASLCPVSRPPSVHVALLIDRTDPYDAIQRSQVSGTIDTLKRQLPVGGRLTVHVITADPAEAAAKALDLCNPGDGSVVDPLIGNPRRIQKRFEEGYAAPIEALLQSLMVAESAERSPIMEALATVAAFQDQTLPRRIVVVSDLLQNSAAQSHYRDRADPAAALVTEPGLLLTDGRLQGVEISFVELPNARSTARQGPALAAFWRDLSLAAGARVVPLAAMLSAMEEPGARA